MTIEEQVMEVREKQAFWQGVVRGGEAGGAGPEDDELAVFGFHGKNLRWTCAFGAQAA